MRPTCDFQAHERGYGAGREACLSSWRRKLGSWRGSGGGGGLGGLLDDVDAELFRELLAISLHHVPEVRDRRVVRALKAACPKELCATRQRLWRLCANSRQHLGWFWTRNEVANLSRELLESCPIIVGGGNGPTKNSL